MVAPNIRQRGRRFGVVWGLGRGEEPPSSVSDVLNLRCEEDGSRERWPAESWACLVGETSLAHAGVFV